MIIQMYGGTGFILRQYLLACYILSGCTMFDIMLSNSLVTEDDELIVNIRFYMERYGKIGFAKKKRFVYLAKN